MRVKTYRIFHPKVGERTGEFTRFHGTYIEGEGVPEAVALRLVNTWNKQVGTSGFVYWID